MSAFEHSNEPLPDTEPNEFIRQEMERESGEALRAALAPDLTPLSSEDEDALFEPNMKGIPRPLR